MADFRRHVTCSSTTGVVVGGVAFLCGVPPATCLVSAGLCGLAGMLPDIDSDSSRSFKTCLHIAAVIGAMLTIQGGRMLRVDPDWVIFAAACVFFFILYTVGSVIKKLTIHRGMIHSIPAAIIAGQFIYIVSEGDTMARIVKGLALSAGFLSHLILDEVYSIDSTGKAFRIKKSFGTALKMIDYKHKHITATFYAVTLLLGSVIANESVLLEELGFPDRSVAQAELPRSAPLKNWLARFTNRQSESPEPLADSVPVESASVDLRPTVSPDSGYAEKALFHRRWQARTELLETAEAPPLPDRPMLFRKFADDATEQIVQRTGDEPMPERIRPIHRNRAPAPIALAE